MDGKGVLLISLCLVLLQVPSLVQTQEEASELRNAEQENAASLLDLIRKQAERSSRKRRTTELPVPIIDVLLTLHERTENNGTVTNVTGTGNSLEHFQTLVSIPGLEKTPVRRNEQLQNLNLHLQKIYIKKQEELLYPDKDNLLLEASKTGNSSAVVFLIAIHANLSASDENNRTPLHLAAKNNHVDIARALLNAGADPEGKDDRKNTALHLAAESAEPEMIKLLVSSGSKLESRNEAGETPLYVAARVGNLEAVRQLVKFNSNVIVRTGNTPLHIAALHGHLDVCEALLDASAGVRLSTSERQTPLHLAALAGHLPVVQLLLERGADAKARNMRGRTPAGVAARKGHKDIVSFLSKH
ncbi:hypothetical protein C0J52_00903 [Blattella germanica]|nr:hypothetical protein C0J52_00903 [Blattella germanica]